MKKLLLDMIMSIKQQFNYKMGEVKQINIKKPNLLFFQWYDQSQRFRISLVKNR